MSGVQFRAELAEAVRDGKKTVTRRPVSTNPRSPWSPDRAPKLVDRGDVAIQPGRGVAAICRRPVVDVRRELFDPKRITVAEARLEGFASPAAFRTTWQSLHGNLDRVDVWRIQFGPAR